MKNIALTAFFMLQVMFSIDSSAEKRPPYADNMEKGINLFENNKYDEAISEFEEVLKKYPNNPVAAYNLGLALYRKGNFSAAINSFTITANSESFYKGPAQYYIGIAQLNLGQNNEALKTAKNYSQNDFISTRMQELSTAIQLGTDASFNNAIAAKKNGNFELCLLEIEDSLFTDTFRGRDLSSKCLHELRGRPVPKLSSTYFKIYLDSQASNSDNVYQQNTDKLEKTVYTIEAGGEYLIKNTIDYGFGANYNYMNAAGLPNFKRETYTANLPLYYRNAGVSLGFSPYYELNKMLAVDLYSAAGTEWHATYSSPRAYSAGIIGKVEKRKSLSKASDYLTGDYGYAKIFLTKYLGDFSINTSVAVDNTATGDQPIGPFAIPTANKAWTYALSLTYDYGKYSSFNLRGSYSEKDFSHEVSPLGTDRKDFTRRLALTYYFKYNRNLKTFLQASGSKNISNYDNNEIINRNYVENLASFGISMLTF